MSRTYRRTKEPVPNWVTKDWVCYGGYFCIPYQITDKRLIKYELAKYHADSQQTMQRTPSWWIHDFHTVKRRARVRKLVQKVKSLEDYENAPEFPLDKKPHIYYW